MSYLTKSAKARRERLERKLRSAGRPEKSALYVRQDPQRRLTIAWFGGREIVAFAPDGMEVSYWLAAGRKEPTFPQVKQSIEDRIASGKYPDRVRPGIRRGFNG